MRLDAYIQQHCQCSKTYAQSLIKDGKVTVNKKIITKNGFEIKETDHIEYTQETMYVSRGAYKLLDAIQSFNVDVMNKQCIDVGASTGGFTQILLEHGAKTVYAVDVGTNQLHPSLKNHPQIIAIENYNCRYMKSFDFPLRFDFACMDVSFISIQKIIPSLLSCMNKDGELIVLIKPQFELSKQHLNKHGVVKNEKIVQQMLVQQQDFFKLHNLKLLALKKCNTIGKTGNQEYLTYLKVGE